MKLKTDRLYIRPVSIEDKELIFEYRSDSETNKYQGWIPTKIEDVDVFMARSASSSVQSASITMVIASVAPLKSPTLRASSLVSSTTAAT